MPAMYSAEELGFRPHSSSEVVSSNSSDEVIHHVGFSTTGLKAFGAPVDLVQLGNLTAAPTDMSTCERTNMRPIILKDTTNTSEMRVLPSMIQHQDGYLASIGYAMEGDDLEIFQSTIESLKTITNEKHWGKFERFENIVQDELEQTWCSAAQPGRQVKVDGDLKDSECSSNCSRLTRAYRGIWDRVNGAHMIWNPHRVVGAVSQVPGSAGVQTYSRSIIVNTRGSNAQVRAFPINDNNALPMLERNTSSVPIHDESGRSQDLPAIVAQETDFYVAQYPSNHPGWNAFAADQNVGRLLLLSDSARGAAFLQSEDGIRRDRVHL